MKAWLTNPIRLFAVIGGFGLADAIFGHTAVPDHTMMVLGLVTIIGLGWPE